MKAILLMLLLTLSTYADLFNEPDKQKHIQVTAALAFVSSGVAYDAGYTEQESFWIGFTLAMIVGVGKELYDSRNGGSGFSGEDIIADGIGATVGALPVFIIYKW